MYTPRLYQESRPEILHGIIHDAPLATLITTPSGGLDVNHIPMVLAPEEGDFGVLRGHVAKSNPVWTNLESGAPAVAVFHGAEYYVSPSWYPSKVQEPRVVPTWNYVVVHVHGIARAMPDQAWLRKHLEELTDRHEAGRVNRWRVSDAPEDFLTKLRDAIVGIEFTITRLDGKVKASQNRSAEDRAGVIEGLLAEGQEKASAMARWVPN